LVSGFEAFGGASVNPTQKLVEELRHPAVETVLLPVVFGDAFSVLQTAIERVRPSFVLALGQAGGRDSIELERVALNLMDAEIADNKGFQPREIPISADGENALFSTLPLRPLLDDLRAKGIPARISNSAGLFVCNDLFYRLQRLASHQHLGLRSGFVHVPYLPEQAVGAAAGKPFMEFTTMQLALDTMISTLLK
jgi:pyroglutamyl-peptidase